MPTIKSNYDAAPTTEELRETIATRIKELRIGHRYKQNHVAELAGINVFTYSGYENARALPPVDCLLRIAEIYGVSLDFIMGRVDTVRTMVGDELDTDDNLEYRVARLEKALRENDITY